MSNHDGGHFGFFDFIKIAQGWQLHTHLDIIMGIPDMNNQKRKKTVSNKTRSTLMAARLYTNETETPWAPSNV